MEDEGDGRGFGTVADEMGGVETADVSDPKYEDATGIVGSWWRGLRSWSPAVDSWGWGVVVEEGGEPWRAG